MNSLKGAHLPTTQVFSKVFLKVRLQLKESKHRIELGL